MKRVVWLAVAALVGAACSKTEEPPVDANVVGEGDPTGFTFAAVGDRSFASFGWMGTFHDLEVPDGTPFSVRVDGPCSDGICKFTGPTQPTTAAPVNRQRCLNRMSKTCTQDSDCVDPTVTGAPKCVFIYDPPTGTPLGGAGGMKGACGWSYIPIAAAGQLPTIRGTMNISTGELNIDDMNIIIQLNGPNGGFRGSCLECQDDVNANDGKADGTCRVAATSGGNETTSPDVGRKCDVHRFGNVAGYAGNYSMDCSPSVQPGDQQNAFGGKFTSSGYRVAITSASPNCTGKGYEGSKCACGMCPDRAGRPPTACFTNADCGGDQCGAMPANCDPNGMPRNSDGSPNTTGFDNTKQPNQCKSPDNPGWFATAPNSCVDAPGGGPACHWDPEKGIGTCTSRLTGQLVGCYPDASVNEIVARGGATKQGKVFIVDTATARCTRSFPVAGSAAQQAAAAATNAQLGLPGLTFQKRSFRVIPEHQTK